MPPILPPPPTPTPYSRAVFHNYKHSSLIHLSTPTKATHRLPGVFRRQAHIHSKRQMLTDHPEYSQRDTPTPPHTDSLCMCQWLLECMGWKNPSHPQKCKTHPPTDSVTQQLSPDSGTSGARVFSTPPSSPIGRQKPPKKESSLCLFLLSSDPTPGELWGGRGGQGKAEL